MVGRVARPSPAQRRLLGRLAPRLCWDVGNDGALELIERAICLRGVMEPELSTRGGMLRAVGHRPVLLNDPSE
jgi:hypothetical protein